MRKIIYILFILSFCYNLFEIEEHNHFSKEDVCIHQTSIPLSTDNTISHKCLPITNICLVDNIYNSLSNYNVANNITIITYSNTVFIHHKFIYTFTYLPNYYINSRAPPAIL